MGFLHDTLEIELSTTLANSKTASVASDAKT